MTTWASPYQAAFPPCSGQAQPGTIGLSVVINGMFRRTTNLGIYNCREVGGGGSWSIHSDGRAWDCGVPMLGGRADTTLGDPILALIAKHATALGVQLVIWNRRIYSERHPDGAPYDGVDPHLNHLHIEQVWYEAQNLSVAEIAEILDGEGGGQGGGTPIEPSEEDAPMRFIHIVGEPADPKLYGYCDDQWWEASAEEVNAFGGSHQVNARERDVIRSRVLTVQKNRAEAAEVANRAIVRREATDGCGRTFQAYVAGMPNQEYSAEEIATIKSWGGRNGILGELYPTE